MLQLKDLFLADKNYLPGFALEICDSKEKVVGNLIGTVHFLTEELAFEVFDEYSEIIKNSDVFACEHLNIDSLNSIAAKVVKINAKDPEEVLDFKLNQIIEKKIRKALTNHYNFKINVHFQNISNLKFMQHQYQRQFQSNTLKSENKILLSKIKKIIENEIAAIVKIKNNFHNKVAKKIALSNQSLSQAKTPDERLGKQLALLYLYSYRAVGLTSGADNELCSIAKIYSKKIIELEPLNFPFQKETDLLLENYLSKFFELINGKTVKEASKSLDKMCEPSLGLSRDWLESKVDIFQKITDNLKSQFTERDPCIGESIYNCIQRKEKITAACGVAHLCGVIQYLQEKNFIVRPIIKQSK